ncbi:MULTISPECIES: pyridoxal phosphate-dependent aminotransferase [unclassified Saccharicrinis]|uniref:pyridoxal phosphate-dependent aminotransferase n=1 Tax=unclassified Saccharicrinis TaxID=2646859 RepID=UPI003D32C40E
MLLGHGNHTLGMEHRIKVDFSSNIWYGSLNGGLISYLETCLNQIRDYPPVDAANLQASIARHHQLHPDNVCITSGATEAFYLIAHCFRQCSSTIISPSFSEYEDAAKVHMHKVSYYENTNLSKESKFSNQLVWLGNPNNPDAKVLSLKTIEYLLKNNPESIFIIDEAYGELCSDFESSVGLVDKYDRLIVVKSVTKFCSIPGLRLGYLVASNKLRDKIAAFRMPWSVSTLALEAGMYIYDRYVDFKMDLKRVTQECSAFKNMIEEIDGITVYPSRTNYFLAKLESSNARELKGYLIENYGFLIRDCSNFYGLDERYFRLSVQGNNNNMACSKAIYQYLNR